MFYPALLHQGKKGGIWVEFPGLDGCFTEGKTKKEALENAEEALNGWLESNFDRELKVLEPEACLRLIRSKRKSFQIPVEPSLQVAIQARRLRLKEKRTLQDVAGNSAYQLYVNAVENPRGNPTIQKLAEKLRGAGYGLQITIQRNRGLSFYLDRR